MKPDKYQQIAIETNKNTLLIAGAGCGKTFTIVEKIKYLINNNICKPEEILILSFTNKSVNDLKTKITFPCHILTFHKLAILLLEKMNLEFQVVQDSYLLEIIDLYFFNLTETPLKEEILTYFSFYNYQKFLNSKMYQQFKDLIFKTIKFIKTNNISKNQFLTLLKKDFFLAKFIYTIKCFYEQELKKQSAFDFDDLIINATNLTNKPSNLKYIIIDEFQDTSLIRFNLINKLRIINKATLFCVGDDYQSIYHFSGCNLNIFLNFQKLIPNAQILKLHTTYRNSQELINISTKFIMKNQAQIAKNLYSHKTLKRPIEFIYYINPRKALQKVLNKLDNNYLILGRNNFDIGYFTKEKVNFLTIHSAKGLEAENVIIINLTNKTYGLPNKSTNHLFLNILHPEDNSYLYAEERRLFYVALTRSKNKVYLLVPIFKPSIFIKELKKIIKSS